MTNAWKTLPTALSVVADESWLDPYLSGGVGSDGEQRLRCPLHGDKTASASVNWQKKVWHCMVCNEGGSLGSLKKRVLQGKANAKAEKADYDPFENLGIKVTGSADAEVIDLASRREKRDAKPERTEPLTEAKVLGYVKALKKSPERLGYLVDERGVTMDTISAYRIGFDELRDRYTLPVYDASGTLVNIRRYLAGADTGQKMRNAMGHGEPPRLYPIANLDNDTVWVVEGEWDALLNTQHGMPSVTGTHGASTWNAAWSKLFAGKTVFLCYDNDKEGRVGMHKAARSLASHAAAVFKVAVPVEEEHGDLSDFYRSGGTAERLREVAGEAEQVVARDSGSDATADAAPMAVPVQVVGSMDSGTNGRPLSMQVTITGKRNPTYSVPRRARMLCTLDAGPKCKACPMNVDHEGEYDVEIKPQDVGTISQFIDANSNQVLETLRKHIGAVKCNRLEHEELENQTIEELFVTGSIDRRTANEEADYTQRRIYNVGAHDTKTNTVAGVVGTTIASHKDRRNEFFSWDLQEAITSIDKFEMTDAMRKRLEIFQPRKGQTAVEKLREIAKDLGDNVTGILGRERLHMAMDLVYHSVLNFPLDGKTISRGWLEFIVVGDTRTGKSETAIHMSDHYGLGHVIGCEGATFAGLVGAVKQVSDAWTIQWGELTINDRRLCTLDEASGLSQDIIGQLSDIRSRGIAQLTKAESAQTRARVRLIWISNPRKGRFVDEKKYDGVDVIEDLIGNPEDIARFDFAMSVSQRDVPNERINTHKRSKVPHIYTSDVCRDLILWAWSRRADHVVWDDDAYKGVYKAAEWLGKRYADNPPLIQRTNVREKVARIAVALAARTFSTDATGECVVVKRDHVKGAMEFLDELYSYDNFGYLRLSQRIQRNRRTAARNRQRIKSWLLENPRLLDFLVDRRGSFRAQDLEEMAHMHRDEVNMVLSKLTEAKMISKEKSQIILEPELHDLLREMETK